MNKSIYTEYANLTPYQIKWLDGCGALWLTEIKFTNFPFQLLPENTHIIFTLNRKFEWRREDQDDLIDYTYLSTGDAFCQGVAEILGIEYVPEGTKSETVTEDKGLAIDVKLLSEEDREWIKKNIPFATTSLALCSEYIAFDGGLGFGSYDFLVTREGLPITTDPTEFMRYVANKTGKEWEPMNDELMNDSDVQAIIDLIGTPPTYPHKTYRVLDSLDGVPFDKRIPLSEWIPPFGTKVKFEFPDNIIYGRVNLISKDGMEVLGKFFKCYVGADGHWMRIV